MNFYVAILILKMEEHKQHFWHIMLYFFKKGKNAAEKQRRICAVCGEGAVTDWMCRRWFETFHAGDFSHRTKLHSRVEQLKSKAIKLRHSLRTVNILRRGRQLTKYPNQYSYWWKWKMSFILQKRLNGLLDQPNTRIWILSYSLLWGSNVADCRTNINIFCL